MSTTLDDILQVWFEGCINLGDSLFGLSSQQKRNMLYEHVDNMSGSEMKYALWQLGFQVPKRAGKRYMYQIISEAYD